MNYCPECQSDAVIVVTRLNLFVCKDCGHDWTAEAPASRAAGDVSICEADSKAARDFCKNLAASAIWVARVAEEWPAPIAHEYHRLREILEEGRIVSAVLQLRDLAEVLIKFPCLVMARWVMEESTDEDLKRRVEKGLLSKPLSMGDWHNLAGNVLSKGLVNAPFPLMTRLAGWLRTPKGDATEVNKLLGKLNKWRNEEIGHGALKLRLSEFTGELGSHTQKLNHVLENTKELWNGVVFQTERGEAIPKGWQGIRERHEGQEAKPHPEERLSLILTHDGRSLSLSPYMMLRRCTVCRKQDIFLFDSRKSKGKKVDLYFLDYLAGHKMGRPGHLEPELAEVPVSPTGDADVSGYAEDDYMPTSMDELLQDKFLESDYLSPVYLRDSLARFTANTDRGVYWLRAPSHTGKSLFVHGLDPQSRLEKKEFLPELKVVAFHIRREYRVDLPLFKEVLTDSLKRTLDIMAKGLELPVLDIHAEEPAREFSKWISSMYDLYKRVKPGEQYKLLICLDGLDEIPTPKPGKGSLLDFLPHVPDLAPGIYILLTSRPRKGCPYGVWDRIQARSEGYHIADMDLSDAPYRRLMRRYFDRNLEERTRKELHEAVQAFVKNHGGLPEKGQLKLTGEDLVGRALKGFYAKGAEDHPKIPKTAEVFLKEMLTPLGRALDQAFEAVLERGEFRFLYVSLLSRMAGDYALPLEALGDLPKGEALYGLYLDNLWKVLTPKHRDPLKRILLMLAAAEQAAVKDMEMQRPVGRKEDEVTPPVEPEKIAAVAWPGIPLNVLAGLMGEKKISFRLLFALYSLKETLRVDRTGAGSARYGLGLKGLLQTIQDRWPDDLRSVHAEIAGSFYGAWKGRFDELDEDDAGDMYRLRYLLAHSDLCGVVPLYLQIWGDAKLGWVFLKQGNQSAKTQSHHTAAVEWFTCAVQLFENIVKEKGEPEEKEGLAVAYANRGNAIQGQGKLEAAVEDCSQAILLLEDLKRIFKETGRELPPKWQESLAVAYMNRGNALVGKWKMEAAVEDYCQAILLLEDLKRFFQETRREFSPRWEHSLAKAYMNRGNAIQGQGKMEAAVEDYCQAILLLEDLKRFFQETGREFQPQWQRSLAGIYMNRGKAIQGQGKMEAAVEDYCQAILLLEDLKRFFQETGREFQPQWQRLLAFAYANRGNAIQGQGKTEAAVEDYCQAILLLEDLKRFFQETGREFPPDWQVSLAIFYKNRGNAIKKQGKMEAAVEDYCQAILLLEDLKRFFQETGREFQPQWQRLLAFAYANRGNAIQGQGKMEAAVEDYCQAILLLEDLKRFFQETGREFQPQWQGSLAGIYINRGKAIQGQGKTEAAVEDYCQAILLLEDLKRFFQETGREFPPDWQVSLAIVYKNRGDVLCDQGKLEAAVDNYAVAIDIFRDLLHSEMEFVTNRYIICLRATLNCVMSWLNQIGQNYSQRQNVVERLLITLSSLLEQEEDEALSETFTRQAMPDLLNCLMETQDVPKLITALELGFKFTREQFVQKEQMEKYDEMRKMKLGFLNAFLEKVDAEKQNQVKTGLQPLIEKYEKIGDKKFAQALKGLITSPSERFFWFAGVKRHLRRLLK